MDRDFRAVWERYASSWRAESSAEKRRLLTDTVSRSCVYRDPLTEAEGWDALIAHMEAFQKQIPGAHFVTQAFMVHHARSIAHWHMVSAAGQKLGEGTSFGEYDDRGELRVMTGFFEAQAPAA